MSNFFEELKNRNVYKVATAYAITAWLLIQVVDTIGPNLGWPENVASNLIKILIVGFPIALVLTWLYEFTPQGLKRTGKVQEETSDNRRAGRRLNRIIIGTLAVLICFLLVERFFMAGYTTINERQKASIAVLPFDYLNSLKDEESLEDQKLLASAIPAQILNELGQISGMFVPAKTSCWMYKDKKDNVKTIAKELEVNYVLEGSIQYIGRGRRIKISTRLINGNNGYTLWSENYEDDLDEIENIQEKIGRKVVSQLRVQLLPAEEKALASKLSKDPEAYRLYLKGKEYATRGTTEDLDKAVDLLNRALDLDPEFAEAHAELSLVYPAQFFRSNLAKDERDEKLKYHLAKALEYGPEKPEVLVASARHKLFGESKDSSLVIDELRKAIELNPNYADAYFILARALSWAKQKPEIFYKYAEKAIELDPLNDRRVEFMAKVYFNLDKEHEKAFAMMDRIIQKDSASDAARYKALFLMQAPYGDMSKSFILIHEAGKKEPNELFNLNYHLMGSLTLDLVPVAEKYGRLLQMAYPENEAHTYDNLAALYEFKGEYSKWKEMTDFWASEKNLDQKTEAISRAYIQIGLGDSGKARKILEEAFPYVMANNVPGDSISYFRSYYDELILYAELLRLEEDSEKADILSNAICEFYRMGPSKNERAPLDVKNEVLLDCYYFSNDTIKFVESLEDRFFKQKDRQKVFLNIKQKWYQRFENQKDVKALFERITQETHRMRAEVIEYLKEEGDWDPAWDKELGLE
ncbi:hypothetical protein [Muriicola soli]|uniref:Uncharacterized protein n=1 Tax=Muriicola soli TaxID=2507538 RepID=A0A411E7Y4_9FLAO|nr:hypothetical protein [Muriicola soli]QBA63831.1 hypothetical protein EQY75_04345 [Muriicola soli]